MKNLLLITGKHSPIYLLFLCLLLTTGINAQTVLTVLPSTAIVNNTMDLNKYATVQTVADNAKSDKTRIDSCSNAIKGLTPGGGGGYSPQTIGGSTYTLSAADNGKTLFFTRSTGCTITAPVLTTNIQVIIVRNGGALGVAPNSNLTLRSSNNYRRISSNSSATISYNSATTATLDGKLTY